MTHLLCRLVWICFAFRQNPRHADPYFIIKDLLLLYSLFSPLSSTSKESAKRAVPRKSEERPAKNTFNQSSNLSTNNTIRYSKQFCCCHSEQFFLVILSVSEESLTCLARDPSLRSGWQADSFKVLSCGFEFWLLSFELLSFWFLIFDLWLFYRHSERQRRIPRLWRNCHSERSEESLTYLA